jgi:hypothetical protein
MLSHSWEARLKALDEIDITKISDYGKNRKVDDIYKTFAFQLGQVIGLYSLKELYTKNDVALEFPEFENYLYRRPGDLQAIQDHKELFSSIIKNLGGVQDGTYVYFPTFGKALDVKNEQYR